MEYKFKAGQRVRFTKQIGRALSSYFGTVHSTPVPQGTFIRPIPAQTVSVLVDGAAGVTTWPIKFWRPKL